MNRSIVELGQCKKGHPINKDDPSTYTETVTKEGYKKFYCTVCRKARYRNMLNAGNCQHGHKVNRDDPDSYYKVTHSSGRETIQCSECKRTKRKAKYERDQVAKTNKLKRLPLIERSHCNNGHEVSESTVVRSYDKTNKCFKFFCRVCQRENQRNKRARDSANDKRNILEKGYCVNRHKIRGIEDCNISSRPGGKVKLTCKKCQTDYDTNKRPPKARKTLANMSHCARGHDLSVYLKIYDSGRRVCLGCRGDDPKKIEIEVKRYDKALIKTNCDHAAVVYNDPHPIVGEFAWCRKCDDALKVIEVIRYLEPNEEPKDKDDVSMEIIEKRMVQWLNVREVTTNRKFNPRF